MASVWFIKPGVARKTITSLNWSFYGIISEDTSWGPENGWSQPESAFNSLQLQILEGDPGFLLGMPDGPRTSPAPAPDGFNDTLSAFAYYYALKNRFEGAAVFYVQQDDPAVTNPSYTGPAVWYKTDIAGNVTDVKVRT